jgi:Clustered mitochondria
VCRVCGCTTVGGCIGVCPVTVFAPTPRLTLIRSITHTTHLHTPTHTHTHTLHINTHPYPYTHTPTPTHTHPPTHTHTHTHTQVFGSMDAGASIEYPGAEHSDIASRLEVLGTRLNLQSHYLGSARVRARLPLDLEAHLGTDQRVYLLDFSRSFPPEWPRSFAHWFRQEGWLVGWLVGWLCVCVCVCVLVCLYVCMYVCMYVVYVCSTVQCSAV